MATKIIIITLLTFIAWQLFQIKMIEIDGFTYILKTLAGQ